MRVLLVTVGSHGDVHPFVAVGRVLAARGHAVSVTTDSYFTRDIVRAGLDARPIRSRLRYESFVQTPNLFHPVHGPLILLRMLDELVPSLIAGVRRAVGELIPDVVLVHHAAIPARWVAEQAGIPHAVAVLSPPAWLAADDPVPAWVTSSRRRDQWVAGALAPPVGALLDAAGRDWMRRERRRHGFAPTRRGLREEFRAGDVNLALWSTAFRPALPSDPPRGFVCGFPWYDGFDPGLPPELERFLAAGEPPVTFTLGSAAVHSASDFFEVAARACERLGRRGVLLTGRGIDVRHALPDGVIAIPWAAHSALFPRSSVIVHHGGIGSTAQALRSGRPSVAVPHAFDQFNNAVRVTRLGAGAMLPRQRLTVARLAAALDGCAGDPAIVRGSADLGVRLTGENGAEVAADHVEGLVELGDARTRVAA